MQRLDLLREDAPAIFRTDGEQPLPYIAPEAARPQFQRPVALELRITTTNGLLHGRGHLAEVVVSHGAQLHRVGWDKK